MKIGDFDQTLAPPGFRAVNGKHYGCCMKCAFFDIDCPDDARCVPSMRPDGCNVYFVQIDAHVDESNPCPTAY